MEETRIRHPCQGKGVITGLVHKDRWAGRRGRSAGRPDRGLSGVASTIYGRGRLIGDARRRAAGVGRTPRAGLKAAARIANVRQLVVCT